MTQDDVERARVIFETLNERGGAAVEELLETYYDPQFIYHPRADEPDASLKPDRDAFAGLVRGWYETFPQISFDIHEIVELGDCVVSVTTLHGRGGASGLEVEDGYVFVYRMRDGLAVEAWEYRTKDEALAAHG